MALVKFRNPALEATLRRVWGRGETKSERLTQSEVFDVETSAL